MADTDTAIGSMALPVRVWPAARAFSPWQEVQAGRVGLAEAVAGAVQGFAACSGKTGEGGVGGARLGGVALQ